MLNVLNPIVIDGDSIFLGLSIKPSVLSAIIDNANGIQKSRFLIASLITFTTSGSFGFAIILLFPKALAPNSSRPAASATIFPFDKISAISLLLEFKKTSNSVFGKNSKIASTEISFEIS